MGASCSLLGGLATTAAAAVAACLVGVRATFDGLMRRRHEGRPDGARSLSLLSNESGTRGAVLRRGRILAWFDLLFMASFGLVVVLGNLILRLSLGIGEISSSSGKLVLGFRVVLMETKTQLLGLEDDGFGGDMIN